MAPTASASLLRQVPHQANHSLDVLVRSLSTTPASSNVVEAAAGVSSSGSGLRVLDVAIPSRTEMIHSLRRCVDSQDVDELISELSAQSLVLSGGDVVFSSRPDSAAMMKLVSTASRLCAEAKEVQLIFDIIHLLQTSLPSAKLSKENSDSGSGVDGATSNGADSTSFVRSALSIVIQDSLAMQRIANYSADARQSTRRDKWTFVDRTIINQALKRLLTVGAAFNAELFTQLVIYLAQHGDLKRLTQVLDTTLYEDHETDGRAVTNTITDVALVYAAEPLIMSGHSKQLVRYVQRYLQDIRQHHLERCDVGLLQSKKGGPDADSQHVYSLAPPEHGKAALTVVVNDDGDRIVGSVTRVSRAILGATYRRLMSNSRLFDGEMDSLSGVYTTMLQFLDGQGELNYVPKEGFCFEIVNMKFRWSYVNELEARGILGTLVETLEECRTVESGIEEDLEDEQHGDLRTVGPDDSDSEDDLDDSSDEDSEDDGDSDEDDDEEDDDDDFKALDDGHDDDLSEIGSALDDSEPASGASIQAVIDSQTGKSSGVFVVNHQFLQDLREVIPFENPGFAYLTEDRTFPHLLFGGTHSSDPALKDLSAQLHAKAQASGRNSEQLILFNAHLFPSTYLRHQKELADGYSATRLLWDGNYAVSRPFLDDPILHQSRRASASKRRNAASSRRNIVSHEEGGLVATPTPTTGLLEGRPDASLASGEPRPETGRPRVIVEAKWSDGSSSRVSPAFESTLSDIVASSLGSKALTAPSKKAGLRAPKADQDGYFDSIAQELFSRVMTMKDGQQEAARSSGSPRESSSSSSSALFSPYWFHQSMLELGTSMDVYDKAMKHVGDLTNSLLGYDPHRQDGRKGKAADDDGKKLTYAERKQLRRQQGKHKQAVEPQSAESKWRKYERVEIADAVFDAMDPFSGSSFQPSHHERYTR
jgi:hypothetical protein